MVLLDMAWRIDPAIRVSPSIPAACHQETYDLIDQVRERYAFASRSITRRRQSWMTSSASTASTPSTAVLALRAALLRHPQGLPLTGRLPASTPGFPAGAATM